MLEDAYDDSGKITRASIRRRLKAIPDHDEPDIGEERETLTRCLELIEAEAEAANPVREAQAVLDHQVLAALYATLAENEIKILVVEDKWFASIKAEIEAEGAATDLSSLPGASRNWKAAITSPCRCWRTKWLGSARKLTGI